MGLKKLLLLLCVCCGIQPLLAQTIPPLQNFSPQTYGAQNQNWSITQTADKTIYAANNLGLLEYNGAKWRIYPTPNSSIMRSVFVFNSRIYSGCYMEFGFWEANTLGELEYTSLSATMGIDLIQDEQFWNIIGHD